MIRITREYSFVNIIVGSTATRDIKQKHYIFIFNNILGIFFHHPHYPSSIGILNYIIFNHRSPALCTSLAHMYVHTHNMKCFKHTHTHTQRVNDLESVFTWSMSLKRQLSCRCVFPHRVEGVKCQDKIFITGRILFGKYKNEWEIGWDETFPRENDL